MYSDAWWRRRSEAELAALNTWPWRPPPQPLEGEDTVIVDLDAQYREIMDLPKNVVDRNQYWPPGFRRTRGTIPHFCVSMLTFGNPTWMFAYLPWTREFGIRMLDPLQPADYQPLRIRPVLFCPWCGSELPKSLRPEWSRRVFPSPREPDRAFDPEIDAGPPIRTPAYYCFDNWWRDERL